MKKEEAQPAATAQRGQPSSFGRFTGIRNSILARPAWLIRIDRRKMKVQVFPDTKRIELIKQGVDKMAFGGVGTFLGFLAIPKIDWDRFGDLSPTWMLVVMVGCLAPLVLLLLWIWQKTGSRKLRWSMGLAAWIGTIALALSGYHLP